VIRKARLEDIMKNRGNNTPSKARVNNLEEEAKSKGLEPIDPIHTLKALDDFDPEQEIDYDIFNYNCEHFVTAWKYGYGFSTQVDAAFKNFLLGASIVLGICAIAGLTYFVITLPKKTKAKRPNKALK
jgi:hypothetical protein